MRENQLFWDVFPYILTGGIMIGTIWYSMARIRNGADEAFSSFPQEQSGEEKKERRMVQSKQVPIDALKTLYNEGGDDVRISCTRLAKRIFINSLETIRILMGKLSSEDSIEDRIEGCRFITGLFNEKEFATNQLIMEVVCEPEIIEALIDGLFFTLEKDRDRRESLVHIRDASFILMTILKQGEELIYLFIEKGIAEFLLTYDEIALKTNKTKKDFKLPILLSFMDETDEVLYDYYVSELVRNVVFINEMHKLKLIDYNSNKISKGFYFMLQQYQMTEIDDDL